MLFHLRRPSRPTAVVNRPEATRWLVLQLGPNPSTDYYIRPRATASGLPVSYRHIDADPPSADDLSPGTRVVIVRYLTPAWAQALHRHHAQLAGVVYFMDDELLNPAAWAELPKPYRQKLARYCQRMHPWIDVLATEYWGSTAALCEAHADRRMQLVPPLPLPEDAHVQPTPWTPDGPLWAFYHGSAAHRAEIEWLRPVVAEALAQNPRLHFEIIGDHEVNKLYRSLPRTRVLHPLSWPNYLSHCRSFRAHIGLVPLLPGPFNLGRSHTKVYDVNRTGAKGLFASSEAYQESATLRPELRLIPMEEEKWLCALNLLLKSTRSTNEPLK